MAVHKLKPRNTALIVNCSDNTNISISNKLITQFNTVSRTYSNLKNALDYMMDHNIDLLVINLDEVELDSYDRINELILYTQTPTLFITMNPLIDDKFNIRKHHPFIEVILATTLEKQFTNVAKILFDKTGSAIKLKHRFEKISQYKKPTSFYVLAALLLCEPIIKTLYMKFDTGFDFEVIFRTLFSMEGFGSNFEYWFMFPVAGIALLSEKSWSFMIFAAVQLYCIFAHFFYVEFTWPHVADSPHISSTFLLIMNSAIVLYFMVPEHRRPFWNKTQKLWRNTARYATNLPTYFTSKNEKLYTSITNISKSGAFFTTKEDISVGDSTSLQFIIDGKVHEIDATVKRTQSIKDQVKGYGVEFNSLTEAEQVVLNDYIERLDTKLQ